MAILHFTKDGQILQYLITSDQRLEYIINRVGDYSLELRTDYFASIVKAIIGQQFSVKVAQTFWQRVRNLCQDFNPQNIDELSMNELKNTGLSTAKATYIKDFSQKVLAGAVNLDSISSLSNQEVISQLTKVKGIGVWTAEMFLIFSLGRLDVFSFGDLGIKRAIQWLYDLPTKPSTQLLQELNQRWAPYQTVASLYLWEVINQRMIKEDSQALKVVNE